ncbi:BrnT family toxin [Erythrobacter sp.]|jgi:uncharacterized DUF497 family protein|uniref:BrnT family toxin n=1 Tax=Erythrobacter sp. TaxID=1042 RepID=UPI002E9A238F|nr:BrnT family toxin [Erythrobacter sp.]
MKVEYDPAKDATNRAKHGVSLAFGERVFDDVFRLVIDASRQTDGENRLKAIGVIDGKVWTAVYTLRGSTVRLISVRRSNGGEQRQYEAYADLSGR